MNPIYLDNNATTTILPEVLEAMDECSRCAFANPASQHLLGRRARQALEDAREGIASLLGAKLGAGGGDRLIFTSGGTEANNLAILGIAGSTPASVVTSSAEHSSVSGCVDELRRRNTRVVELEVDQRGLLSPDDLSQTITRDTRLVSLILGNHETGVLQPIARLAAICNAAGVPLHSDAVQAVGKIPLHFHDSGVAALSFSAHKFHGPRGIGALLLRRDVSLQPILFGGFQQQGLRPGTEPVPLAVGMFRALEICLRDAHERWGRVASLRDRFEQQLTEQIPELVINGRHAPRLPHVSNVGFPGLDRQALLMALDLAGIACSTGSACASGSSDPSPVLRAMKLPAEVIQGSLRFSFSALTEPTEVVEAAACIVKIHNSLQSMICRQKASRPSRHGTSKTI